MSQRWSCLTFLHWAFKPERIEPLIPSPLKLDTSAGEAWIGLVPFNICDLRKHWAPALLWISLSPKQSEPLWTTPIEHKRWPLQSAKIDRLTQTLLQECGLPAPEGDPILHYSEDLEVKIGSIQRLR